MDLFYACRYNHIRESLDEFENWPDPGRLLVSMATDRVIMENMVLPLFFSFFSFFFFSILFIFAGDDDMHESSMEFEFLPDPTDDF